MKRGILNYGSSIAALIILLGVLSMTATGQTPQTTPEPMISNTLGFGAAAGYSICHDAHVGAVHLEFLSRIRLGSIMGLEGSVGYTGEHRMDFISKSGQDVAATLHSIPVGGSLLLFLPIAPTFTPYLVGGLAAHYVVLDYSEDLNNSGLGDDSRTRFGYHLGFGLEVPLNEHVALMGDYRYVHVDNAFEEELQVDFSSAKYTSNLFMAGVMVYF